MSPIGARRAIHATSAPRAGKAQSRFSRRCILFLNSWLTSPITQAFHMKCRFHAVTADHHKKLPKGYQGYKLGRGTISGRHPVDMERHCGSGGKLASFD
jgi:hypothetical protein